MLQSRRGIGGGYSLIKPPEEISLAQVIRIIDGPLAPLGCVSKIDYGYIQIIIEDSEVVQIDKLEETRLN